MSETAIIANDRDPFAACNWGWPLNVLARRQHYWRNGSASMSLCRRHEIAYGDFDEVPTHPCKECLRLLAAPARSTVKREEGDV